METYDFNWCDDERGPYKSTQSNKDTVGVELPNSINNAKDVMCCLDEMKWDLLWNEVEYTDLTFDFKVADSDTESSFIEAHDGSDSELLDSNAQCFDELVKNYFAYT